MGKELLLVGAGHAHLSTFRNLHHITAAGHRVTVVSPSARYHYSGMGPGVLSGRYRPEEGRIEMRRLVELRGARFLEDRVVEIEAPRGRVILASGKRLSFDIASFNIGSRIPVDGFSRFEGPVITAKPIENFLHARRALLEMIAAGRRLELVVVGGGPAGLEIAGNLWRLVRAGGAAATITLVAGGTLLGRFPERLRRLAAASLAARGIRVLEQRRVVALEAGRSGHGEGRVVLDGAETLPMSFAVVASGVQLSPVFRDSGLPVGPDLGLQVNEYLQCPQCSRIFGGGDCVCFGPERLAKVGVVAYRQNPVLYHNLLAALNDGASLRAFRPDPVYSLMFNLGDGSALWWRGAMAWKGRIPFLVKDAIDRRFMTRYRRAETRLG